MVVRSVDWIRRYSLCFLICFIILIIQMFLAYKLFPTDAISSSHRRDPLGKSPVFAEDDGVSSRKFKEGLLTDDEDIAAINSNQVHKRREKVPPDKASHVKGNQTVELRLEDLDFVPPCEITGREAVSAIHRARTQLCKQELANLTCLAQQGRLYAERLQSLCPAPGVVAGKPHGCFQDERTFRLLSGYYANLKHTNSPEYCINLCLQSGFQFAGVQYSTECFCGNDEPLASARLPDSSCNMPCSGDPHKACGGFFTINVFQTGLAKVSPLAPRSVPLEPSERRARVAYLLTLNGRASRQVTRLLRALYHSDHFFYIHVDARQDYLFREMLKLEQQLPNHVKVARSRLATIWGGASLLQVLLSSMKDLLSLHHKWPWDFVINLSESDFPLKSNEQLVQFLTANKGRNFVKSFGREVQRFIQKQGLDKTFHECENHMWRVGDRTLPWGIQMDGGSDWVALSYSFVKYVASGNDDDLLIGLKTVFRHTLLPAESFFHTALRNSYLCETYVDNNLHVTNWRRRLGCKCQYRHVVDWCGCSPNDFKSTDWSRLQGTEDRQVYFARKFEPIVSQAVIKQLEEWLYGPHLPGLVGLDSYWQSLWHKDDIAPPADDALVTVGHSLTRLAVRNLCPGVQAANLVEITSYHHEDAHLGVLVKYMTKKSTENETIFMLESWIKSRSTLTILNPEASLSSRIKALYASSDFDVKEQMSRNLLGALGPFSQPTAVINIGIAQESETGSGVNASLLWLDPVGWLADITEIHIDDTVQVLSSKPSLKSPLRPGIWSLKLAVSGHAIAQAYFLISPLELMSGVEIHSMQAEVLHAGPTQPYEVVTPTFLTDLLADPHGPHSSALLRKALINARRTGKDLQDWIDSLVARFYSVSASCIVHQQTLDKNCPILDTCLSMPWSSLSPDPKSGIGVINKTSGKLE